jgi:7-cyano-7-deazaguanine synthase
MSDAPVLVLNGGGLRSLVATAATVADAGPGRVSVLHLSQPRHRGARMLEAARGQAAHYQIARFLELRLPQQLVQPTGLVPAEEVRPALAAPLLLVVGLGQAVQIGAERLVWPAQADTRFEDCARMAEQAVLAQSLAQLEQPRPVSIQTPLLDLDDQQVIELGAQLQVAWTLAWSCRLDGDKPCRVCDACRRRRAAFEAAGLVDPVDEALTAR